MERRLFFIVGFLMLFVAKAQNSIEVEYSVTTKSGNTGKDIILKINNNSSVFGKIEKLNQEVNSGANKKDDKLYIVPKKTKLIFKDYEKKQMISNERISLDSYIVKDSLENIIWKTYSDEKTILGYICKKAETHFRGRDYVVFYTDNIKVSDGPWKLSGLPGLILEASTKDNFIHFEALKINFSEDKSTVVNPFLNDKINFSSYSEFKTEYVRKYNELKKGTVHSDGHIIKSEIPKSNIEVYVE
jgi:GLPGLI family protein